MNSTAFELLTKKHENNPSYDDQLKYVQDYLNNYSWSFVKEGFLLDSATKPSIRLVPCMDIHLKHPLVLVYDKGRNVFQFLSVLMSNELLHRRFTNDLKKEVNILQEIVACLVDGVDCDTILDLVAWSFEGARFSFDKKHNLNDLSFGTLPLFRFHNNDNHPKVSLWVDYQDGQYGIELGDVLKERLEFYQRKVNNHPLIHQKDIDLLDSDTDYTGIYEYAISNIPRLAYLRRRHIAMDKRAL